MSNPCLWRRVPALVLAAIALAPMVGSRAIAQESPVAGGGSCISDPDCDDADACTTDACINSACVLTPVAGCISCAPTPACSFVDLVFVMDTSGSMDDEAAALCATVELVISDLATMGISASPQALGITEQPGGAFSCLSGDVATMFCSGPACSNGACPFPDSLSAFESWGPATAVVAEQFNWTPDAARIIIPMGDEGPCNGDAPDGCIDPGDDRAAIDLAIAAANANGVIVSPITGTGAGTCTKTLASDLARSTGGMTFSMTLPGTELRAAILDAILNACGTTDACDDQDFCTRGDTCVAGVCTGNPVAGCEPCSASGFCSDGNACTDDVCSGLDCITTPNFNESAFCCDPDTGGLAEIDDQDECTNDVCTPDTGVVSHPAVVDGAPCDDGAFCSVDNTCTGGLCGGGVPRDCRQLDDQCNEGVCDEANDVCRPSPINDGLLCDDNDPCLVGEVCGSGQCAGGVGVTCPDNQDICTDSTCDPTGTAGNCDGIVAVNENLACDDGDVCAIGETCQAGACLGSQPVVCPDNGDVCSNADCDAAGSEGNCDLIVPINAGGSCSDADDCTVEDACAASGRCVGTDINTISCTGDVDCFGSRCDLGTNTCFCTNTPLLSLAPQSGVVSGGGCFVVDEEVVLNVELGFGTALVHDGSYSVTYDPTMLSFISAAPGDNADASSPFTLEGALDVDETAGTICYSTSIANGEPGVNGPVVAATLRFRSLGGCTSTEVCFVDQAVCSTGLLDESGGGIPVEPRCTGSIRQLDALPTLTCPRSTSVKAAPGGVTAVVTWPEPTATAGCADDPPTLNCTVSHSNNINLSSLITFGGLFPTGDAVFSCTATDSCGETASCEWTVAVADSSAVVGALQLSPTVVSNSLPRCIEFEFFANCAEPPVRIEKTVAFGGPFNLTGLADPVQFEVPTGTYVCVTARDRLHTLRSTASLGIANGAFTFDFTGDPVFGGRWLVGGNINGDAAIDVLDFGAFVNQSQHVVIPETPCGVSGPHSDFNGDGIVDGIDFSFIALNFLTADMPGCCPGTTAAIDNSAVSRISVRELERNGLGHLRSADLNGDGYLDVNDMSSYLSGVRPSKRTRPRR